MSTISAGTTTNSALVQTGDTTGQLVFQTNGTTTAMTISTGQVVTLAQPLPVASGGTGASTASGSFNAISPITTTGDLIVGNGVNSATRLGIGTNNYVLTSNGTTAVWAQAASGAQGYVTQTQMDTTLLNANTGIGYGLI